jgi:hypothetical protein
MSNNTASALNDLSLSDAYYACTFPECGELFANKRDWKRHENSQHHQYECWHCEICRYLTFNRASFVQHLQAEHAGIVDASNDEYIEYRHIHQNYQGSFWCGFCQDVMKMKERGVDGWHERFDHIEAHFVDGDRIEAWVEF